MHITNRPVLQQVCMKAKTDSCVPAPLHQCAAPGRSTSSGCALCSRSSAETGQKWSRLFQVDWLQSSRVEITDCIKSILGLNCKRTSYTGSCQTDVELRRSTELPFREIDPKFERNLNDTSHFCPFINQHLNFSIYSLQVRSPTKATSDKLT